MFLSIRRNLSFCSFKQNLKALSMNPKTSTTVLYRDLVKFCIKEPNVLANANAETLCQDHSIVIACRGKV